MPIYFCCEVVPSCLHFFLKRNINNTNTAKQLCSNNTVFFEKTINHQKNEKQKFNKNS